MGAGQVGKACLYPWALSILLSKVKALRGEDLAAFAQKASSALTGM